MLRMPVSHDAEGGGNEEAVIKKMDHPKHHICIFAGTTEGRKLAQFLGHQQIRTTVCVATAYGGELIPAQEGLEIRAGRMAPEEIIDLLRKERFDLVIDATHPYAAEVTENIRQACASCGIRLHRLGREDSAIQEDAVYVASAEDAAECLKQTEGSVLLTTGSKELGVFARIPGFAERVYARVLPMEASLRACSDVQLPPSHIIAMQGPFSEELNTAMLKGISAKWMVTKDGGSAGGFAQKVQAAKKCGTRLVIIGRPEHSEGAKLEETIRMLCEQYGCAAVPEIYVIGTGPGRDGLMAQEAHRVIRTADCLIGAGRMVRERAGAGQEVYEAVSPEKIAAYIRKHPQWQQIAVLMSGDTGFFSGTKKLLPLLQGYVLHVIPGISSLVYLCAKLGISHEDVFPVSLHGRSRNIAADVMRHRRVFALVGGTDGMKDLCRKLVEAGLNEVKVSIGERLSYPQERITTGTAQELAAGTYDPLSVALIEHAQANAVITPGLPDEAFLRGEGKRGVIPMTKSEVRAILLSRLQLKEDSVCWDIGAGTGSVSVEMARLAHKGVVYAIEKEEDAVGLIRRNMEHFHVDNIIPVTGSAPQALRDLPAPTHVFIGGSADQMRSILALILEKNPEARIVATAIALETIAELTECIRVFSFRQTETVAVNIARDRKAGAWHLMMSQNPVYVFTMQEPEHIGE